MRTQYRAVIWSTLMAMAFLTASSVYAQFKSGSDGSDGELKLTAPGTIIFDPRARGLDQDGDNVYHFTTITIGSGVTVRLLGPQLNMKPVWWLASGEVKIDGIIDLNGEDGYSITGPGGDRRPSQPGAGGYPGGVGNLPPSLAQQGTGPGGGGLQSGGGYAQKGEGFVAGIGGPAYGNVFLVPLLGGSGGGGGSNPTLPEAGGGAGGRALLIASSSSITVNGEIQAKGGNGGTVQDRGGGNGRGGGGGSGGAIHLKAVTLGGTGALNTAGGIGDANPTVNHYAGSGSFGRIRLEAFQNNFTGNVANGASSVASPSTVFLPTKFPSVRVVSVAGVAVPEVPGGGFTNTDVTIAAATAAEVQIKAHNIPLGTVVKLHAFSQNADDQIVDSTPLVGTFADSTATVSLVFPLGFSRAFPRATWTNP